MQYLKKKDVYCFNMEYYLESVSLNITIVQFKTQNGIWDLNCDKCIYI